MLDSLIHTTSTLYPENLAVIDGNKRINYAQLQAFIDRFSNDLIEAGVGTSDRIALILPNCLEFVVGFYATVRVGAISLPLNPLLKNDEITYYLKDSNVGLIITNRACAKKYQHVIATLEGSIKVIALDSVLDQYAPLQHANSDAAAGTSDVQHRPDQPALLQYSSGSTGRPKQVARTHHNLYAEADNFTATASVTNQDVILCMVPLFHAHGLGNCLLAATRTGATLVILEQPVQGDNLLDVPFIARCSRVFALIERERVTVIPGVPYIFSALAAAQVEKEPSLDTVRLCFSAGNFLPQDVFDQFFQRFGVQVKQLYGCTEAGSVTINLEDGPELAASVGKPIRNVIIHVLDERNNQLSAEQTGEIALRSPMLTSGYTGLEELNREVFRDGFYLTGDLGRLDAAGRLYITGRKKIFIDVGGRKVDPLEIEDVLLRHPKVREVVVVGVKPAHGGEIIKAVVVPEGTCTPGELLILCKEKLADFKVPRIVEFRAEIPKSPLGKILRKNLVDEAGLASFEVLDSDLRQKFVAATSRQQRQALIKSCVRQQLGRILGLEPAQVSAVKALSDFGLDSARAIELQVCLEQMLGVSLSATMVWQYPSMDDLIQYLADTVAAHLGGDHISADDARDSRQPGVDVGPAASDIEDLSAEAIQALLDAHINGILPPPATSGGASRFPETPTLDSGGNLEQLSDDDVTQLLLQEFARLSQHDHPAA
jgi:long-chain acyl-CoA synthetase